MFTFHMKRLSLLIYTVIAILQIFSSCNSKEKSDHFFNDFSEIYTLEGKAIKMPDSVIRVLGHADVTDNSYIFFMYDSPNYLSTSDKNFENFFDFGVKGQAPGELQFASLTGYNKEDGSYDIYDCNAKKLYRFIPGSNYSLEEIISFPQSFNEYDPLKIVPLSNGTYAAPRGDFKYGMINYNPTTGEVIEWPLGDDFDNENPENQEVSKRIIKYNKEKKLIAEVYGCYPTVILHDEDGNIVKRLTYTKYKKPASYDSSASCFSSIFLTTKYIWLLYGETFDNSNQVLVIDYDGNPIAQLLIQPTMNIVVDEQENKLITTDPNQEENNLVVYDLPEFLFN